MLIRLTLRDFALLQRTEISFGSGLTVITGETGAGKSLLVGALAFLAGGKPNFGVVRDGARLAVVEGEFSRPNGEVLIIRRQIASDGRSRAFIDDEPVGLHQLAEITVSLLDITSQRAFSRLLDPEQHLAILDAYAGLGLERTNLSKLAGTYHTLQSKLNSLRNTIEEFDQRRDFIRHQLDEIEAVSPQLNEDVELLAELKRLEHFEDLQRDGLRIVSLLTGDREAVDLQLSEVQKLLERIAEFDPSLADLQAEIDGSITTIREVSRRVLERCRSGRSEAGQLEAMQERHHKLSGLSRKYGGSLNAVFEKWEKIKAELAQGTNLGDEMEALEHDLEKTAKEWILLAGKVSKRRSEASPRIEAAVSAGLRSLGIGEPRFEVRLTRTEDANGLFEANGLKWRLTERGVEDAEFYFSANPGIAPRPVASVASGGELSRVMLALKESLPLQSDEATILFDEIDSGVSGKTARLVGLKMRAISKGRQLLVITHLPQIAALADRHLKVKKGEEGGVAVTEVAEVEGDERKNAIAVMLSGGKVTESALQQASLLMNES